MTDLRFRFAPRKAYQALHWMAAQSSPVDLHTVLKAFYFADVGHLNEHLQPIFGATYRAMRYGPVPLEIYEIAKAESLWLSELSIDTLPWELRGYRLHLVGNRQTNTDALSESNMAHLRAGLDTSLRMTFNQRTAATHGPDWQAANGGLMHYEDMLADRPDKPEIIADLRETAAHIKL